MQPDDQLRTLREFVESLARRDVKCQPRRSPYVLVVLEAGAVLAQIDGMYQSKQKGGE